MNFFSTWMCHVVYCRAQERRVSTLQLWNVSKQDLVPFLLKVGKFDDRAIIFVEQKHPTVLLDSIVAKNATLCLKIIKNVSFQFCILK